MKVTTSSFLLSVCAVFFTLLFIMFAVPKPAYAVFTDADKMCNPVDTRCGCGTVMTPKGCKPGTNWHQCPGYCKDNTNGFTTTGVCVAPNKCLGQQTQGLDGKGMEAVMKGLMDALQKLMQGQQSGSGSGSGSETSQPPPTCSIAATLNTTTSTATSTTATSTDVSTSTATTTLATLSWTSSNATEATIEPGIGTVGTTGTRIVVPLSGTTYVLNVTGPGGYYSCSATISGGAGVSSIASNIGDTLLNALDSGNQTSIADLLNAAANNQNASNGSSATGVNTVLGLNSDGTAPATTSRVTLGLPSSGLGRTVTPTPGQQGNILIDKTGATIVAGVRTSNSETASFYGSGSSLSQPTTFVGKLCTSRPWASGLVAAVIPASFFDSLCSWQGYQVGTLAPTGTGTSIVQQTAQQQPRKAIPETPVSPLTIHPQAKIWAQPAAVRLGSRTSIFWTSSDVQSCTVSGPNFSANTLAGGASTVPLSGEATFTIKCSAADGTSVTQSTTVTIAI